MIDNEYIKSGQRFRNDPAPRRQQYRHTQTRIVPCELGKDGISLQKCSISTLKRVSSLSSVKISTSPTQTCDKNFLKCSTIAKVATLLERSLTMLRKFLKTRKNPLLNLLTTLCLLNFLARVNSIVPRIKFQVDKHDSAAEK